MPPSRSISTERSSRRRLLGRAVLLAGVLLALVPLLRSASSESSLRYRLGADHARYERIELRYFHGGLEVAGGRYDFPGGAPPTLDHVVRLPQGEVRVEVSLRGEDREERRDHRFESPAEGTLVFSP